MPAERRPGSMSNLVIGLGVLGLGVALILERFGVVDARTLLRLWPLLLVLLGASLVLEALWGGRATGGTAGEKGGVSGLWVVLVIVALFAWQAQRRSEIGQGPSEDETVTLVALMSGDHRTSVATRFRAADMTTVMGGTRLDLRQAAIDPSGPAVIDVFTLMGGATVYVPRHWIVDVQVVPFMGGVRDARALPSGTDDDEADDDDVAEDDVRARRRGGQDRGEALRGGETLAPLDPPTDGVSPRVVIRGFLMMGGLVIRS